MSEAACRPGTLRLRGVFAAVVALYMFLGPFYTQVLGQPYTLFVRSWVMYQNFGLDVCEASFVEVRDGEKVPVDRYALFGHSTLDDPPKRFRRLKSHRAVGLHALDICRKLGGNPDLRVRASCATQAGWRTVYVGERNACGPSFVVPERKGRRR